MSEINEMNEMMNTQETAVPTTETEQVVAAIAAETTAPSESAVPAEPETNAVPTTESASEPAQVTDKETPAPAPARRTRSRMRPAEAPAAETSAPATVAGDYMAGFFNVLTNKNLYKDEMARIQAIIDNNVAVSKTGKGQYQYLMAMMTGSDEVRENNNPDKLKEVRIYAIEVMNKEKDMYGHLRLTFTSDDFTFYSSIVPDEEETTGVGLKRRQRRYASHAAGSLFQCVPLQINDPEDGSEPSVICSRAFAMEKQQSRYLFGDESECVKVGDAVVAYILAVNEANVRVECMGIETRIPRAHLTATQIITDATKVYKPGDAIEVVVTQLDVDKENRIINRLRLSGVRREVQLGLVKNVKSIDLSTKPREYAYVTGVTNTFYQVQLVASKLMGIVNRNNVKFGRVLHVGDSVTMEITGYNEETNRVYGGCV